MYQHIARENATIFSDNDELVKYKVLLVSNMQVQKEKISSIINIDYLWECIF